MEKNIKSLFNDDILRQVARLYEIELEDLKPVGGFENFIYGFEKGHTDYIVRISHSSHRTLEQVISELDFVNFLANYDAPVSTPILSKNQKLVEEVLCQDGTYFTISVFTRAPGEKPNRTMQSAEFFENYGRTIGCFHWLTKMYQPGIGVTKRFKWDEDPLFKNAHLYLQAEDSIILERFYGLIEEMNQLPVSNHNYGLIHTDIHMGNFFVKDNELSVFDFDDCSYMWFVSDIAIALFYYIDFQQITEELKLEKAKFFLKYFMIGYLRENKLTKTDFLYIEKFLKLREIVLYIVFFRSVDLKTNKFAANYIETHRERIIQKTPFLNMDYKQFI